MKTNYWAKFEVNCTYHIYNRGINGCNLFYKSENYRYFLQKWAHYLHPLLDVYAYCLMPNHFHFIASPNKSFWESLEYLNIEQAFPEREVLQQRLYQVLRGTLSLNECLELEFKDFFGAYSKGINKQEQRTGSLFQQRFKRVKLRSIAHIVEKIVYTHHNPIHHGFCSNYNNWVHSSYSVFLSDAPSRINRINVSTLFDIYIQENNIICYDGRNAFLQVHEDYRLQPPKNDEYNMEE
jgi:putative transposase